ncbi:glycoside hydrolase superfamily [Tricharina praecox]|uniref:glycoside hydrolase superfamily n=1 Tax=Tricharina praecox TaxID=43433 RepID=UPI00221FB205|nr:glycoside hydrolase superfamily [Tricharina praecox]KAI5856326.1 glycoside hydrolase superfamily [Tricharina praecox]
MAGMQRSYSFDANDDDPSYYPLRPQQQQQEAAHYHQQRSQEPQFYAPPVAQPPVYHQSPSQHHQNYLSPQAPQRYPSDVSWGEPPHRSVSESSMSSVGIEHQPTVIRKSLPPAAAAAAAAALHAVQEDVAPSPVERDERYWAPELGYAQRGQPDGAYPYPSQRSTPASQAPLLPGPPAPPAHARGTGNGNDSPGGRQRVLVDPLLGQYTDNPYQRMSTTWDPALSQSQFDGANDVLSDDDDDWGKKGGKKGKGMGGIAAATAGVGATGGIKGGAVESGGLLASGARAGVNEKSDWLRSNENSSRKRRRWVIGIILVVIIAGIAAGTAAGVLLSKRGNNNDNSSGAPSGPSAADDLRQNGLLDKNSAEIKALMNNPDLHKVFHGMDYTPLGGVYPECLTWPPTQNNITRDIAVLSLLTDKVRLYGTDCNQTEMVLHAIDALGVDMTVWIGVWLDGNSTTNTRQLNHLYTLLSDEKHHDKYAGVAVGNEVLFAKTLTQTQLFNIISEVRTNLTTLGYNIPVGTSDLGSNWKTEMASEVDVLMANVHPFFAGVVVEKAANWTYTFFQENDVVLTDGLSPKPRVMISEVGWPSGGGSTGGSVAGIDEMNTFMADFVCKENARGTEYFWFSGFDEPWKIRYNEPKLGKEWEDKWGLLDVNRKLKKGLTIPDCK